MLRPHSMRTCRADRADSSLLQSDRQPLRKQLPMVARFAEMRGAGDIPEGTSQRGLCQRVLCQRGLCHRCFFLGLNGVYWAVLLLLAAMLAAVCQPPSQSDGCLALNILTLRLPPVEIAADPAALDRVPSATLAITNCAGPRPE